MGRLYGTRQQRWVELTPEDVYTAVYDRVCNGLQSHYISASSVNPVTKTAEEAKYMQLKFERLAPFRVGGDRTRTQ